MKLPAEQSKSENPEGKTWEIRQVPHLSSDYYRLVELRRAILRIPLGLDLTQGELEQEVEEIHLGLFENEKALACLVLVPQDRRVVRMRQVAVRPERQGLGLGAALVAESERIATNLGYQEMTLHARESAVPFYLKLNYSILGDPFEEVGIPHRAMRKPLHSNPVTT